MNEIQVRAKYSNSTAKIMLYVMLALLPIWGVLSPVAIVTFLIAGVFNWSAIFYMPAMFLGFLGGFIVLTCSSAFACIVLADDKLIANPNGLRIPFHASLLTVMRRDFPWDEITNLTFAGDIESESQNFSVCFKTNTEMEFNIKAGKLTANELEQFLLAIELWMDSQRVDQRLAQVKETLQRRLSIGDSKQSYTAMWEDELERRFNSTAFVVLEPGSTLQSGKLKVVRQLSFGGLSAVYLCQQDNRDLVVLKESVVPADSSDELRQKAEEMFAREARLLMRLKHPNIVSVLDYFVEKGRNYLLLEHINGQDLNQHVRQNGAQPEYKVLEWAKKLAEVLEYLHTQDPPIVHRDLSPDNIVLDQNHSIKIIDFGAANEFLGTATGTLVGKQSYLPMEQLRGKAGPQSDFYAFGGTLHFLLTGQDPEPLAVSHPRALRPELSQRIDDIVAQCTDADPKKRPKKASDLLELYAVNKT